MHKKYVKSIKIGKFFVLTRMSHHRHGPRRISNNFSFRKKEESQNLSSASGFYEETYSERGRLPRFGGRPPGLRGKEIGLYYRDKNREKAKKITYFKLLPQIEQNIRSTLDKSDIFYNFAFSEFDSSYCDMYHHINDSPFKKKFLRIVRGNIEENLIKAMNRESKLQRNSILDSVLLNEYEEKQTQKDYLKMLENRSKLPAYHMKSEILELIENNQVIVVSGETGCGKTTQIAQFILDDQLKAGNGSITQIICTQPRRISAVSVAERVAMERAEKLGKSVGYQIRLETTPRREQGSILFCTTGILLQTIKSDPALKDFSHVILDEIHERGTESDFIITLLKQILPKRKDLKVLLMSATLNSERFSKYYDYCPMIHIPGFTHPVKEFYLEDVLSITRYAFPKKPEEPKGYKLHLKGYKNILLKKDEFSDTVLSYIRQLEAEMKYPISVTNQLRNMKSEDLSVEHIEQLVRYICKEKDPGAILIFLPGMMDISNLHRLMLDSNYYRSDKYIIYPLHSRMPTVDQKLIFEKPPDGIRKIIIATSIAETSITIEDVVYVIDSGKIKLGRFNLDMNIQTLEPEWVSLANAKQRRGRAGRVKSGECYHMYSKGREMTFGQYPLPEMLRTRLDEIILKIKILQLGKVREFLSNVMDPPDSKAIDLSLSLLRKLNALDEDENLTPLGYHLAYLPLDPRTGKMILWAALFSCIEPILAIAASLTFKDAFYCPIGKENEANRKKIELTMGEYSDHIAFAEALRRFEIAYRDGYAGRFCRDYFLSFNTLKLLSEMKTQFAQYLFNMNFLDSEDPSDRKANRNSDNITLIKAIVCAGLYPNIAIVSRTTNTEMILRTPEDNRDVRIHPSSVNNKTIHLPSPYLTYFTKKLSTAIYLHDTTCINIPILMFAGSNIMIRQEKGRSVISYFDHSDSIICDLQSIKLIQKLQKALNTLLEYKITHPATISWSTFEGDLLRTIIKLICQDDDILNRHEATSSKNTYY